MMNDKPERQMLIKRLILLFPPDIGVSPEYLHQHTCLDLRLIHRDLKEIGAARVFRGRYTYHPTQQEIDFARLIVKRTEGGESK